MSARNRNVYVVMGHNLGHPAKGVKGGEAFPSKVFSLESKAIANANESERIMNEAFTDSYYIFWVMKMRVR